MFDELGSPYVYPVKDYNGNLAIFLRYKGVGAFEWPGDDFPLEVKKNSRDFPIANKLNSQVVCLPIHHFLRQSEKEYIVSLLEKYLTLYA